MASPSEIGLLLACWQVLENHLAGFQLVWPQDDHVGNALAVGVADLLAQADRLQDLLGIDARLSQASGQGQRLGVEIVV